MQTFKHYAFDLSYFTKCLFEHVRDIAAGLNPGHISWFTKYSLYMECDNLNSWKKKRHANTQTTIIILFDILMIKWVNPPKTTRQLLCMLKLEILYIIWTAHINAVPFPSNYFTSILPNSAPTCSLSCVHLSMISNLVSVEDPTI